MTEHVRWVKSSLSFSNSNCVEVTPLPGGGMAVRDSKNPGPVLAFTAAEWAAFIAGVRNGEFDGHAAGETMSGAAGP